ncbi:hypothetical protein [Umezawaea beigongshangensis]|uniref:hypothetical protein n=1 Tax=Umezawaea beigongshangensis TaxID=2780383 RepID=UPI0018F1F709|nr:hypothetical protein [Umezawaea beigongshangensis]
MRLIALTALLAALSGYPTTSAAAAPPERAAFAAVEQPTVLDHAGLGPIRIGTTFTEARATGLIGAPHSSTPGPCAFYGLNLPLRGAVVFDQSDKAVSIIITRGPGTTEGLSNGHEPSRVPEFYPSAVPDAHGYKIALDTGNEYSAYSVDGTVIARSISGGSCTAYGVRLRQPATEPAVERASATTSTGPYLRQL